MKWLKATPNKEPSQTMAVVGANDKNYYSTGFTCLVLLIDGCISFKTEKAVTILKQIFFCNLRALRI